MDVQCRHVERWELEVSRGPGDEWPDFTREPEYARQKPLTIRPDFIKFDVIAGKPGPRNVRLFGRRVIQGGSALGAVTRTDFWKQDSIPDWVLDLIREAAASQGLHLERGALLG